MSNKQKTQKQAERFYTRAIIDASTIVDTPEERSFWVTAATENPIFRRGWEENFNEVLLCDKKNIRAERLDSGVVPLLDNHYRWDGVKGQMGAAREFKIENKVLRAQILFSVREEFKGIWDDIKRGVINGISVGYNVYKYLRETTGAEDKTIPTYRAVDWEPLEISLAPVPADFKSKIRSDEERTQHDVIIEDYSPVQNTRSNMEEQKPVVEKKETTTTQTPEPAARSVQGENTAPAPVNEGQIRAAATAEERTRAAEIRSAVKAAKLGEQIAEDLITRGVTIDVARAEIINKMAEADKTPAVNSARADNISVKGDEIENTRKAMSDALMHRANPGSVKLEDKSSQYKHMDMLTMARQCLIASGDSNALSYSPNETVKRAIATTDYPNLLNSTVERTIRKVYDAYPAVWKNIARQTTAKDFREKTGIAVDGKVSFEEIAEGGEYKHAVLIQDDAAKIKLKTYGKAIKITRQAIINDDLDVFGKLPQLIARGAANFQADAVWNLLLQNAKTPDNIALFHTASHKNLAASGGALSEATLSAGRTAMWRHKTPVGEPMPIEAKYLIVPMELMTAAEKLMTSIVATATGDVNVFANKLQIMTDPRITDPTAWYLAGDPQENEGLVYAYLQGEEGLYTERQVSFEDDTVTTKARLDFATAAWDYRNFYKNPGA